LSTLLGHQLYNLKKVALVKETIKPLQNIIRLNHFFSTNKKAQVENLLLIFLALAKQVSFKPLYLQRAPLVKNL
jgi:hypothetical protein